jgi:hypothetical protein
MLRVFLFSFKCTFYTNFFDMKVNIFYKKVKNRNCSKQSINRKMVARPKNKYHYKLINKLLVFFVWVIN